MQPPATAEISLGEPPCMSGCLPSFPCSTLVPGYAAWHPKAAPTSTALAAAYATRGGGRASNGTAGYTIGNQKYRQREAPYFLPGHVSAAALASRRPGSEAAHRPYIHRVSLPPFLRV